ncbi:RNA polymerase-associated protein LEO1 [Lemmus lemmus]
MGGFGVLGKSETDISCSFPDRPHCTDGATYKKLTLSFGKPSSKTQIRILPMAECDPEWPRTEIQKKRQRLSSQRNFHSKRKNQLHSSPTIEQPDDEDKEEEEEEDDTTSRLETIENHYQGAVHKEQALSSLDGDDEGSEDDKARRFLKAKTHE